MPLNPINIPSDELKNIAYPPGAESLIDHANERIETFMLANSVTENFVPCDFHLVAQALVWIEQNHLLAGDRFCEWGSGLGVVALLASLQGMESVGIEIESNLVEQASILADELELSTEFHCGSFIPRNIPGILELSAGYERVETHEDDVYDDVGLSLGDFDLFFAFPWPGDELFFESIFEAKAADNALLLTYRGHNGMHVCRKT